MRNINKKGIYTSIIDQLKLHEEFRNITQCKYHQWILRTFSEWILIICGWWVTVQNCARRKRTSIRCASNLPSPLWNITTKVHNHHIDTDLMRNINKKGIHTSIIDQLKLHEEFRIITQCMYHHWILRIYFRMNFDNSWMVSYGSKLRKKEDNSDKMCFESSKPIVENHD